MVDKNLLILLTIPIVITLYKTACFLYNEYKKDKHLNEINKQMDKLSGPRRL